MAAAVYASQEP